MPSDLELMYRQVKAEARIAREHYNAVRELAWFLFNPKRAYTWRWWRLGFQTRFGKLVDRHDFTAIPGYDELAQEVAETFPQYEGVEGCERLWELLMSTYEPMPRRDVLMAEAEWRLDEYRRQAKREVAESFSFGANIETELV